MTENATIRDVVDAIDHQTDQISAGFEEVLSVLRSALVWEEPPPGMLDEIKAKAEAREAQKRAQERGDAPLADADADQVSLEGGPEIGAQEGAQRRSVPRSHTEWVPKGLIEHLSRQQTFAPDSGTSEAIQVLIDALHEHRPIGNDGKHGERHTETCGCEDKPATGAPETAQTLADLEPCLGDRVRVRSVCFPERVYRFRLGWFQSTKTRGFFAWCNEAEHTYLLLDSDWTVLEHLEPVTPEEPPVGAGMLVDRYGDLWRRGEHGWQTWLRDHWTLEGCWDGVLMAGPLRPATSDGLDRHGVDEDGEPLSDRTYSERGFAQHQPIPGGTTYGGHVRAYESSAASAPRIWLNVKQESGDEATLHMSLEAVDALIADLSDLRRNHYQLAGESRG